MSAYWFYIHFWTRPGLNNLPLSIAGWHFQWVSFFSTSHWVYLLFLAVSLFMGFRFVSFSVSARKCFQLSWLYSAQIKGNRPTDPPTHRTTAWIPTSLPCILKFSTFSSCLAHCSFIRLWLRFLQVLCSIYIYIYSLLSPSWCDLVAGVPGLLRGLGHVCPRGDWGLDICDLNISELIYQIKAGLLIQATEHRNLSANMAAHPRRLTQTHTGHRTHLHPHRHAHLFITNAQRY